MEHQAEVRFPNNELANMVWDSDNKDLMNRFFKKGTAFIMQDPEMKLSAESQGANLQNPPRNLPVPPQEDHPIR